MTALSGQVEAATAAIGFSVSQTACDRLVRYAEEIVRWNRRINLTGAKTPEAFVSGPLFDALTLIPVLSETAGAFVDIGSGGGLPGIPTAVISPQRVVTLVEPRAKRVSFLHHIVHELDLDVRVLTARDEVLTEQWDEAAAQAVFSPAEWAARAGRLIAPGGSFYVLSAEPFSDADMPAGATIEAEFQCVRPPGQVPRFSYRVSLSMAQPEVRGR